jgi:hypothetical protein
MEGVPKVEDVGDFEICRAKKERGKSAGSTGQYEVLNGVVKDAGLVNWDVLFLQFRDEDGECKYFLNLVHKSPFYVIAYITNLFRIYLDFRQRLAHRSYATQSIRGR